jgi:predicted MFS family arabinose efflux permease
LKSNAIAATRPPGGGGGDGRLSGIGPGVLPDGPDGDPATHRRGVEYGSRVRRAVVTVYALLFLGQVVWSAIIPLLPAYKDDLGLTAVQTAALLTSASLAILVVSLPSGILADRLGPRWPVLAAAGVIVVTTAWQAVADGYVSLLAARTAFGLAYGLVWSTGPALVTTLVPPEQRARAMAVTMTMAGVGGVAGPALTAALAPAYGRGAPFAVCAAVAAVAAAVLLIVGGDAGRAPARTAGASARTVVDASMRDESVRASAILMAVGGAVGGVVNLLVPLTLRGEGMSTAEIGTVFTVASLVFVGTSAFVAREAPRAARLGIAASLIALVGVALLVLAAGGVLPTISATVVVRGVLVAALYTLTFPIGLAGAESVGMGPGSVAGLGNVSYAVAAVISPILAGAGAQSIGAGATFVAFAVTSLAAAGVVAGSRLQPLGRRLARRPV